MAGIFSGGVFSAPYVARFNRDTFFLENFKSVSDNAFFGATPYSFNINSSIATDSYSSLKIATLFSIYSSVINGISSYTKMSSKFNASSSISISTTSIISIPFGGSCYSSISSSTVSSAHIASKFAITSNATTEISSFNKFKSYFSSYSSISTTCTSLLKYEIRQKDTKDKNVIYADYRETKIIVPQTKKRDR